MNDSEICRRHLEHSEDSHLGFAISWWLILVKHLRESDEIILDLSLR
jgi:transcription elongation factor GreA-like protein